MPSVLALFSFATRHLSLVLLALFSFITMSAFLQTSILLLVVAAVVRLLMVGRRPKNYPPGPPTIPILGNIHLVSTRTPL